MQRIFTGEKKNFEVYSCHVSPDGSRLATAAGGEFDTLCASVLVDSYQIATFGFGPQKQSTIAMILPTTNRDSWLP